MNRKNAEKLAFLELEWLNKGQEQRNSRIAQLRFWSMGLVAGVSSVTNIRPSLFLYGVAILFLLTFCFLLFDRYYTELILRVERRKKQLANLLRHGKVPTENYPQLTPTRPEFIKEHLWYFAMFVISIGILYLRLQQC